MDPEEWNEEDYLADCEVNIEGKVLTPENTLVHLYQPHCWDIIEIETEDGKIRDVIIEEFVIKAMILSGYHFQEHGTPTDSYREWYITSVLQPMESELRAFYDNPQGV